MRVSCHALVLLWALISPAALSFSPLARSIHIGRATAAVPPTFLFSGVSDTQDEPAVIEESAEVVDSAETVEGHSDTPDEPAVIEESAEVVDSAETVDGDDAEPKKRVIKRDRHTLFVGNLPFEIKDAELRDLFSQHGTVELVSIPINRETGRARGFAFVDMSSKEEVQAAIDNLAGTSFGGRTLRVNESLPKDEAKKQAKRTDVGAQKLYVGNLPFDSDREDVRELYSKYGNVRDVYFPLNQETGAPRGFAFVTLDEENAEQAIEETNGLEFMGRPLVVSLPLPPGEKTARKERPARQKLYIGNLSFYTVPDTLRELFEEFGEVHDCYMPEDPETGGSRGFGFVTLNKDASEAAVDATNGCELDGRIIRVNEAQPKGAPMKRNTDDEDDGDWSEDGDGF